MSWDDIENLTRIKKLFVEEFEKMRAKYQGVCWGCGEDIKVGDAAVYYGEGEIYHKDCRPLGGEKELGRTSGVKKWDEEKDAFAHLFEQSSELPKKDEWSGEYSDVD
jgi:hypothetical protein